MPPGPSTFTVGESIVQYATSDGVWVPALVEGQDSGSPPVLSLFVGPGQYHVDGIAYDADGGQGTYKYDVHTSVTGTLAITGDLTATTGAAVSGGNITLTGGGAVISATFKPPSDLGGNLGAAAARFTSLFGATLKDGNSTNRMLFVTGQGNTYVSGVTSPTGGSIAHLINTNGSWPSGSYVAAFENNGSVRAYVDADGNIETPVVGAGFILKSPDGTRYKIAVANDGTLSASAA